MILLEDLGYAYVPFGTIEVARNFIPGATYVPNQTSIPLLNNNAEQPVPVNPQPAWNTFTSPDYDNAAYGTGIHSSSTTYYHTEGDGVTKVNAPLFKKVHLLRKTDTDLTYASQVIIQFEGSDADFAALNPVRAYSREQWLLFCNPVGYNRNAGAAANLLPPGFSVSVVDGLGHASGAIALDYTTGQPVDPTVPVYLLPIFVRNARPIFDLAYFASPEPIDYSQSNENPAFTGLNGHLIRWRGGVVSENRAPVGFNDQSATGLAIPQGQVYQANGVSGDNPLIPQGEVVDGVTYTGANAYNVTNNLK